MQNQWNPEDAARFADDLGQCVYASRLLGANPALVLHGGGNTSVKIQQTDIFGEPRTLLYVKGSGSDSWPASMPRTSRRCAWTTCAA